MKDLLRGHRVALLPAFIKVVVELPLAHEVQQKTVREERERERKMGTEGRQAGKWAGGQTGRRARGVAFEAGQVGHR